MLFFQRTTPSSPTWTLDFWARDFSAVFTHLEPTIFFSYWSAVFTHLEPTILFSYWSAVFTHFEPTIDFSHWSAVSHLKPRDFRLLMSPRSFFPLVCGFPHRKCYDALDQSGASIGTKRAQFTTYVSRCKYCSFGEVYINLQNLYGLSGSCQATHK